MDLLTRHQATFLLWAQVQFNEPGLVEIGQWNLGRFQTVIAERLVAAGAHPSHAEYRSAGHAVRRAVELLRSTW